MPGVKPTILLAEDSPTNAVLLMLLLGDDHDVLLARDGRRAVEVAKTEQPDIIIMDGMMPVLDGFEACAKLKEDPVTAGIPIIFLTGLEDEEREIRALELGAFDFISKPIRPALVRARIRNCLELKRQRDLLAQLSFTDGLTGLANRRRFDEVMELEWRRAARARRQLSVLLMDVDCFKLFNDTRGHVAGDDCLRRVAMAAATAMRRPGDLLARYGGEEFACVLPESDLDGARFLAERIREQVEALGLPHPASKCKPVVTVSVGVATVVPGDDREPGWLLEAADRGLYLAKERGRNQVGVALADSSIAAA
ncbi:MAG: diguanylate cyclase [Anaeromyxobacter sp.]